MTRSLLVLASAGLVALGIPLSGLSSTVGTHSVKRVRVSSSSTLARHVEKELATANHVGVLAESAVTQGNKQASLKDAEKLVQDMGQIRSLWGQYRGVTTALMRQDLTITMNTIMGVDHELKTVGWVGTGSMVRSLMASWSTGATLLRLTGSKILGTTSYSTTLPAPTVTTVTTMPSATFSRNAASTSRKNPKTDHDDKGKSGNGEKGRQGRGHIQPGHKPKHHRHHRHH